MNSDASELGILLAAEDFPSDEFSKFHNFSASDEQIIRRLIVPGPVLLRGPRGSGKSAYMLCAHNRINERESSVFCAYISLRYFPLISANPNDYLGILVPYVASHIHEQLKSAGLSAPDALRSAQDVGTLQLSLNEVALQEKRRIVLMFDDAAHIGREISLSGFFDFFRTLSSSLISCKASIYPGVTKFGSRFDLYSDATVVEAQRDERTPDFAQFFQKVLEIRHPTILQKTDGPFLTQHLAMLLGRAVLGNVRAFNAVCVELDKSPSITNHVVGDTFKWLAAGYLYPALEELQTKLGAYKPMLKIAEDILPTLFTDAGRSKVNSIVIHKDHVQRLGKVFEILEYSGFASKREASRALARRKGGRGPRYALNFGPLFEHIPGLTLGKETIELLLRVTIPNSELVEIDSDSELQRFSCPEPDNEISLDILSQPVSKLRQSNALPYGLTELMIEELTKYGCVSIQDVVQLSVEQLQRIDRIGPAKATRIKNAVEQAIWM